MIDFLTDHNIVPVAYSPVGKPGYFTKPDSRHPKGTQFPAPDKEPILVKIA